jgi:hypothetical protein
MPLFKASLSEGASRRLGPLGRETQGRAGGGGGRQFISIDAVGIVQVKFKTLETFVGGMGTVS